MDNKKTKQKFSTREISVIAIFTALTAVLAQIAFPLPFTPTPISFGLVAVYITGMLLKPRHAVFSQICYLALGAVGAPVFGNFSGGIGALLGPTGGYLATYPIMAWIVATALNSPKSLRAEQKQHGSLTFLKAGISMLISHTILYLCGTIWLSFATGNSFKASLALAVYPFILLDIFKIAFCIFVVVPFRSRLKAMNLLILDNEPGGNNNFANN